MVDGLTVSRGSLILGQLAVCLLFYIGGFGVDLFRRSDSAHGYWMERVVGLWSVCSSGISIEERTCCDNTRMDESFCPALYNAQGFVFGSVLPCSLALALLLHRQLGRRLPSGIRAMPMVAGLNLVAMVFGIATTTQLWALWANKDFNMVQRERSFHLTMIASIASVVLIAWNSAVIVVDGAEGPQQNLLRDCRMKAGHLVGLLCCVSGMAFGGTTAAFIITGFRASAYPWVLVDFLGMSMCVLCMLGLMMKCRGTEPEMPQDSQPHTQEPEQRYASLLDVKDTVVGLDDVELDDGVNRATE